jgi:UDP-2,3-diacylglucosamine hydrolase
MKETVYFISDAHLGINYRGLDQREKHLVSFFRSIRDTASHLFIVGDLFDFWIEYRFAIRPDYFILLHELRLLIENGASIYYLAGNHDFALGPFLEKTIGLHICPDHLDITLQGKRVHLFHGDGILKSDVGYRLWRAVLRNPINQKIYKCLHPNIGIPIAKLFSGSSRHFLANRWNEKKKHAYLRAAKHYLDNGADIIIMGHTHLPQLYTFGGKIYCNTGEWLRRYYYTTLERGKLTLWEYLPGEPPVTIDPISI